MKETIKLLLLGLCAGLLLADCIHNSSGGGSIVSPVPHTVSAQAPTGPLGTMASVSCVVSSSFGSQTNTSMQTQLCTFTDGQKWVVMTSAPNGVMTRTAGGTVLW